jgi:hypothetical protein
MAWNAIRRAVTARLRLESQAWLEKRLNDELPALQVQFQRTLQAGDLPELEADFEKWVEDALAAARTPKLDAAP